MTASEARVAPIFVRHPETDRRFYTGIAVVSLLTVLVGFVRSIELRGMPPSIVIQSHAAVFGAWVVLFVVQTALVAAKRTHIHRRLGIAGGVLAAVMLPLGIMTAIIGARRGFNPARAEDPVAFMVIPLFDMVVFGTFVVCALQYRRIPEVHKRFMLLATIAGLVPAAITRLPHIAGRPLAITIASALFLMAGPVYDRAVYGRTHPVYFWGGWLSFLSVPVRLAIGRTELWHQFGNWLIR